MSRNPNAEQPHQLGLAIPLRSIASRLCGAFGLTVATECRKMQIGLPLRLSTTGIVGLAALSATHWMRENISDPPPLLAFALGVMPNLAAAFAMPLVLACFFPHTSGVPVTVKSRRTYLWILLFTALGLLGWELVQTRSERFVFDAYDILATGFGSILAYLAFGWHVRRFQVSHREATRGEA